MRTGKTLPVLTKEEEQCLFRIYHHEETSPKDQKTAKDILVLSNVRLATKVAKRYQNFGIPMADLMQTSVVGLVRAVEKFDHTRGLKFSSYAPFWVRQVIGDALEKAPEIYIPPAKRKLMFDLRRLLAESGLSLADPVEVIGEKLSMSPEEIRYIIGLSTTRTISIETPAGEDQSLGDVLGYVHDYKFDSASPLPQKVLSSLSWRDATIVDYALNLSGMHKRCYSFVEIARMMNTGEAEVNRAYQGIMLRLREKFGQELLKSIHGG